ncbi:pleiotropic drug resistance protein 3-like [Gossypium australe]|uniref:Pleiotropic drug resistance protein 3-like n=1 Tax=Gossypium australe TaxID=47621 RepID=A0A5B6WIR9_9ROSI|nr:pleiotropic drug resistance protein 3-like [Gossypium australe]
MTIVEPFNFDRAAKEDYWKEAIEAEMEMIHKNGTLELVDRPTHRKIIGVKWVFKTKHNAVGFLNKHKARLIVKGYSQHCGKCTSSDDKSAFLNGFLKEEIFVEKPDGCKAKNETLLIVFLYVDDLLVTSSKSELIKEFKKQMQDVFEMTDLGLMTYFLDMEENHNEHGIFISQQAFILKILSNKSDHERVDEKGYRSLVGCLLYLTTTRPDIMYGVSLLSRFMHCSNTTHFKVAKRVLRYVKGTLNFGVKFEKAKELKLLGYSESDWARSVDDMKSTSGYFFHSRFKGLLLDF